MSIKYSKFGYVVAIFTLASGVYSEPSAEENQEKAELIKILEKRPVDLGTLYYFKDLPLYDAVKERLESIHFIKTENPQCYIEIAQERLSPKNTALSRIVAMEREENPRPLVFETDEEWTEFQDDLRKALKELSGPDAFAVLLGSGTTFFSESPVKGENSALKTNYPACLNPEIKENIYTFDTPGYDKSDIDLHLFIPELSKLCHQALENKPRTFKFNGGNDGQRAVYGENLLNYCLRASQDPKIKNMVRPVNAKKYIGKNGIINAQASLLASLVPGTALEEFYLKWSEKLGRPLNLSPRILPAHLKAPAGVPDKMDFAGEPMLERRFVIKLNDAPSAETTGEADKPSE